MVFMEGGASDARGVGSGWEVDVMMANCLVAVEWTREARRLACVSNPSTKKMPYDVFFFGFWWPG